MRYITAMGLKMSILASSVDQSSLGSDLILSKKAKQSRIHAALLPCNHGRHYTTGLAH